MQRHVERRQALLGDAADVSVGQVGEGDEVPLEKRQPVVVVSQVQRFAHALGKLFHEAERAAIPARSNAVEEGLGELHSPRFVDLPTKRHGARDPVTVLHLEGGLRTIGQPLPVQDITHLDAFHGDDRITGHKRSACSGRTRGHGRDHTTHRPGVATRGVGSAVHRLLHRLDGVDDSSHLLVGR